MIYEETGWTEAEEIKAILMPKQNDKHRNIVKDLLSTAR